MYCFTLKHIIVCFLLQYKLCCVLFLTKRIKNDFLFYKMSKIKKDLHLF